MLGKEGWERWTCLRIDAWGGCFSPAAPREGKTQGQAWTEPLSSSEGLNSRRHHLARQTRGCGGTARSVT